MIRVIAEAGINWEKLNTAYRFIKQSAEIGCWAIKFQLFNEKTIANSPIKEKLIPLILDESDVAKLREEADKQKIGFILTPMYLEAVDIADEFCDEYIKIRFKDHENQELIDLALNTGKTLLISVPHLPLEAYKMFNPRIRWMYCLDKYPPDIEDFNLEIASSCHGFSSHFPNTLCDLAWAINRSHQDAFLEKHVMFAEKIMLGKTLCCGDEGGAWTKRTYTPIDAKVSITFEQLKNLKSQLDQIERIGRIRL